ncbi:hypothetical protein [Nocardia sp. NPDC049149]|uniref:phage upper tail fiber protein n=1 Tax=Nocardia sp. NPDC049149 TaxID=3364315 RepID=UPI0037247D47
MTVISEPIENIAGADDTTAFLFGTRLRESADGTGFITDRWQRYTAVNGVLTTGNLDPGLALVRIGAEMRTVEIPNSGTAVRLWPIWDAGGVPTGDTTSFVVNGGGIRRIEALTQSEYTALSAPDPATFYVIFSG